MENKGFFVFFPEFDVGSVDVGNKQNVNSSQSRHRC